MREGSHDHEEEGERKRGNFGEGRDACMIMAVNREEMKAREFSSQHYERQMSERGEETVRMKMNKPRLRRERKRRLMAVAIMEEERKREQ